jgi:hypothetical protein
MMNTQKLLPVLIIAVGLPLGLVSGADEFRNRFNAKTPAEAEAWQRHGRALMFQLMKIDDLQTTRTDAGTPIPFEVKERKSEDQEKYTVKEIELASTKNRRIKAVVTIPKPIVGVSKHPAIVCIHGHGGNRYIVHDKKSIYGGFAAELAERGYVTIATDVGQHTLADPQRTLCGERLWDLLRCADYVVSLPEVDAKRIGCAGLSLGGEMAMWLGAMDPRMKATVSSGFLTTVANMRDKHCPCWEFPGLTYHYDFSDVFSLIAPRALMCQNGQKETRGGGFPVDLAEMAMKDIHRAYAVFDKTNAAELDIHPQGHVFVVPTALAFIEKHVPSKN